MKSLQNLTAAIALSGLFFTVSCNSGEEKKVEETPAADSIVVLAPVKPANIMAVTIKVADYTKWLTAYESHDTARLSHGLHDFVICRGTKDTSMLMVVMKMDDLAQAQAFSESPDLKDAMKKSGVISKPEIRYLDVQMMDTTTDNISQRVLVSHTVKDYDAWKVGFDKGKQARIDGGLTDRTLSYEIGNNKKVVISFLINDAAKADAFMDSKDLKDKMAEAGVEGPPTFFFYSIAKKY